MKRARVADAFNLGSKNSGVYVMVIAAKSTLEPLALSHVDMILEAYEVHRSASTFSLGVGVLNSARFDEPLNSIEVAWRKRPALESSNTCSWCGCHPQRQLRRANHLVNSR